ncbi:hypothetical protein ACIRPK_06735 [Kitasatospora sp. NPDC101801]|uniref:hypothetical protein n=1 Tax=Kitasatospora sp. NPDC101801 TaxID=3364103 RepID=UPI003802DB6B
MTDEDTPVRRAEGGTGRAARAPLPELLREFEELAAERDARRRGRRLEQLVERVFHQAHFRVDRNPVAGTPGRDDLVAGLAGRQYLVEVVPVRHPVDVGTVDGLWSRLRRAGQGLVGVLVTVAGLAPDLAAQVLQNRRMGPVLVLDDADLRRVLTDPGRLGRLLEQKREQLEAHDTVHLGRAEPEAPEPAVGSRPAEELPGSDTTLHDPSGGTVPFVVAAGSYAQQVFTLDLPATGAGVALDLSLPLRDESQLLDLLDELDGLGWVTPGAGWAIGRGGRTWHGAGAAEFEAALTGRPKGADSETESIVWYDRCDGGFYTIGADVSLGDQRRVTWCGISFRLIGVPLDPTPFQHLHTRFGARGRGWFRPLTEQPVERYGTWRPGAVLEVVGSIVQDGESPAGRGWVVGVVARNPFHATGAGVPEGWPLRAGEDGLLLAALRDHHPAGEPEREYRLYGWELVRSSDVAVLRVVAGAD